MLNYLWTGMIFAGILFGWYNGKIPDLTNAALDSAKEAVTLAVTMLGVTAFWSGLMEIASEAGMISAVSERMRPVMRFLFPNLPEDHPAQNHISSNFIANLLGLGWAATPAGLRAMENLEKLENDRRNGKVSGIVRKKGVAGNEMCTFLIVNISSLQLVPINIIAYRSQYGSQDPAGIVGYGLLATAISTATAVVFCRIMDRKRENTRNQKKFL